MFQWLNFKLICMTSVYEILIAGGCKSHRCDVSLHRPDIADLSRHHVWVNFSFSSDVCCIIVIVFFSESSKRIVVLEILFSLVLTWDISPLHTLCINWKIMLGEHLHYPCMSWKLWGTCMYFRGNAMPAFWGELAELHSPRFNNCRHEKSLRILLHELNICSHLQRN